ncbi:MAG: antitoxin [Anaerolineae bacterium]|nr:MAG: antitoxin [Anaerolineae bacterium]
MKTTRIFRNGNSQAVRLPRQFRFQGDRVYIRRLGNAVILLPYQAPWETLIESLSAFSEDFMRERGQPPTQSREDISPAQESI